MLEYIIGRPAEVQPAYAVIDNNGMGYGVNITLIDYPHIAAAKEPVKLYVYEAIREDAHILYGFLDKVSRELFLLLITVSGVGPNTARLILSSMTAQQLQGATRRRQRRPAEGRQGNRRQDRPAHHRGPEG